MLQITVIGNLGSDAKVEESNGRKFVSFNVGHNDRYTAQDSTVRETTQWVSCALNGDGGALLPYLTKGRSVYVQGRGSTRVYSSPKEKRFVAGLNVSVDRIELLASASDAVPKRLADADGVLHVVHKAFYVLQEEAKALGAKKGAPATLLAQDGREYAVDDLGWITPVQEQQPSDSSNTVEANG